MASGSPPHLACGLLIFLILLMHNHISLVTVRLCGSLLRDHLQTLSRSYHLPFLHLVEERTRETFPLVTQETFPLVEEHTQETLSLT